MQPHWFAIVGLAADIIGVVLIAWPLVRASDAEIAAGAGGYVPLGNTDEARLALPAGRSRIRERKFTRVGVMLIVFGFLLQIIAILAEARVTGV